ncbi:hypothetical protein D3C87_1961060 [compost metagenome]
MAGDDHLSVITEEHQLQLQPCFGSIKKSFIQVDNLFDVSNKATTRSADSRN